MLRCYITDRRTLPNGRALLDSISAHLQAGADWIQIREKDLFARELYDLVQAALALPNPRNVPILVNSRVDVALAAGAAGAHLPSNSPAPRSWRGLVPKGFLIGVFLPHRRRSTNRGRAGCRLRRLWTCLPAAFQGLRSGAPRSGQPGGGCGRNQPSSAGTGWRYKPKRRALHGCRG